MRFWRANGDRREQFELQIGVHSDSAYNLARWLLRNDDDAMDALQDALLSAFKAFGRVEVANPKAWFLQIVRNACYKTLGSRAQEQPLDENEDGGDQTIEILDRLEAQQLLRLVDRLPVAYKEVFVLREVEGLSYSEIAEVLGVPTGTVMSRLARAREMLLRKVEASHK
ncbi:MAG: sigma-70 family RNA polymerase sigma factor [Armatimonadetes bacterium]|nr:sigma-70 family RNA polymerase sigma factor [Armatimonadota bacterium]